MAAEAFLDLPDIPIPLHRLGAVTTSTDLDDVTAAAVAPFDYTWDGTSTHQPWALPVLPDDYALGVIVGSSGSGKSSLLRLLGEATAAPAWEPHQAIAAHFPDAEDAVARLTAVGLASVPLWTRPYDVLSNGERFRADLARQMHHGARIDEFSSVVDRHVAQAASAGLARYVRGHNLRGVVLATCHRDVLPWLQPDWYIDTDSGHMVLRPREWLQPPTVVVEIRRATRAAWDHFARHHYLTGTLHPFARCYVATWDDTLVGFASSIPFPHGHLHRAWRETRTVVLPEFQGLGLGVRLSDAVAGLHVSEGLRYFSRTQHPRMGEYRERSSLWRATSSNRKRATAPKRQAATWGHRKFDETRLAYSHEYIGPGVGDRLAEPLDAVPTTLPADQASLFD